MTRTKEADMFNTHSFIPSIKHFWKHDATHARHVRCLGHEWGRRAQLPGGDVRVSEFWDGSRRRQRVFREFGRQRRWVHLGRRISLRSNGWDKLNACRVDDLRCPSRSKVTWFHQHPRPRPRGFKSCNSRLVQLSRVYVCVCPDTSTPRRTATLHTTRRITPRDLVDSRRGSLWRFSATCLR